MNRITSHHSYHPSSSHLHNRRKEGGVDKQMGAVQFRDIWNFSTCELCLLPICTPATVWSLHLLYLCTDAERETNAPEPGKKIVYMQIVCHKFDPFARRTPARMCTTIGIESASVGYFPSLPFDTRNGFSGKILFSSLFIFDFARIPFMASTCFGANSTATVKMLQCHGMHVYWHRRISSHTRKNTP